MKRIKKVNRKSAQSVYSFGCPCDGSCEPNCVCDGIPNRKISINLNDMSANNPHRTTGV